MRSDLLKHGGGVFFFRVWVTSESYQDVAVSAVNADAAVAARLALVDDATTLDRARYLAEKISRLRAALAEAERERDEARAGLGFLEVITWQRAELARKDAALREINDSCPQETDDSKLLAATYALATDSDGRVVITVTGREYLRMVRDREVSALASPIAGGTT